MTGNASQLERRPLGVAAGGALAASVVTVAAALRNEGLARKLLVQCFILALRCCTPLAIATALRAFWLHASPRHLHLRRLLRYGLISWTFAETAFLVYIWQCKRFLDSQTTRRWRAVRAHSTEEKRRASMERYLLALTQVCRGGDASSVSLPGTSKATSDMPKALAMTRRRPQITGAGLGSSGGLQRTGSMAALAAGLKRTGSMAALARTGSFLGLGPEEPAAGGGESVEDLLKHLDQSNENFEEDLRRLRWHELASFFHGPGRGDAEEITSWLRRGNVEEWIAHYWFRGATPEELREETPQDYQELRRLVARVLESATLLDLPEGKNPHVYAFRIFTDPLPVMHRPLFVYAGTSLLCPLLTLQVMKFMGFRRERAGGLCYWKRPRRNDVDEEIDLAAPRQTPLVFVHGLGVGLVPYYLLIARLSRRHSGDLYIPEFPFLAMAPWESVPSAREVVAQLQDMLAANGHTAAHWCGHSFGSIVIGWVTKMSPSSVVYATLMEPAQFLVIKAEALTNILWGAPKTCFHMLIRYFAFRELFTVNLLCRNFFWEQSSMWPEEMRVPAIVSLAGDDHIVQSTFVRRLLEHEKAARRLKRKETRKPRMPLSGSSTDVRVDTLQQAAAQRSQGSEASLDILWLEGFFHGQVLFDSRAQNRIFSRMRQMVQESGPA